MLINNVADSRYADAIARQTISGYWTVADRHFFNKAECFRYASSIKNYNISYNWFRSTFDSLDWTTESFLNLDKLYLERALQIRNKYKHVMLAFSGGIDSTNILDTFLENNIQLDEIVCWYPLKVIENLLPKFDYNNKDPNNLIFEYVMACAPRLKQISVSHPNIKITLLDSTQDAIELVSSSDAISMAMSGISMNPVLAGQLKLAKYMKDIAEKNESICCVVGSDKPKIIYDPITRKFGTHQHDFPNIICKTSVDGYVPVMESFYWSPDLPQIFYAQSWALKRALVPLLSVEEHPAEIKQISSFTHDGKIKIDEHTDIVKRVLYKNFNPALWQVPKTPSIFYQSNAAWFFNKDGITDERTQSFFNGQFKEWIHGIDDCLIEREPNGRPKWFRHCFTSPRWLT